MRASCLLLILGLLSAASSDFSEGSHDTKKDWLLFTHAANIHFRTDRPTFFLEFNMCKRYEIKIHHVELKQYRGKEMTVKMTKGGTGRPFVGLELTTAVESFVNFEVKVWGVWTGSTMVVNHEKHYHLGTGWKMCPPPKPKKAPR